MILLRCFALSQGEEIDWAVHWFIYLPASFGEGGG